MIDNTFELLTKMYADFSLQFKEVKEDIKTLKSDVSTLKDDVGTLKSDVRTLKDDVATLKGSVSKLETTVAKLETKVTKLETSVAKIELKLENDVDRKIDILLETRGEVNKRLDNIENKIDIITANVEKHDIEIKVIKAVK